MANIKVVPFEEAEGRLREIYELLIEKRGKLADIHIVQSLNPESIMVHMDLYMTIMFGSSPLSREQRELMAVVVSVANKCVYCQKHHSAALNLYWKNADRVGQLLQHYEQAELSAKDIHLCAFAWSITRDPGKTGRETLIEDLRQSGFDDRAILDATLVVAYFNFVNRIVLALDVQPEKDAGEGYKY